MGPKLQRFVIQLNHPSRYEGSVHGGFGNILLLLSVALAALDSLGLIKRAIAFYRQPSRDWSVFVRDVLRTEKEHWAAAANRYEMVGLTEHEHEHGHEDEYDDRDEREHASQVVFALGEDEDEDEEPAPQARTLVSGSEHAKPQRPPLPMRQYSPASRTSTASEGTLHDTPSPSSSNGSFSHKHHGSRTGAYDQPAEAEEPVWQPRSERMNVRRFLEICLTWVRRTQVVIAYVVLLTGIAIYTVRPGYLGATSWLTSAGHVSWQLHQRLRCALHQGQHLLWVSRPERRTRV